MTHYKPQLKDILAAKEQIKEVVFETPLHKSTSISKRNDASVFLKREDMQEVHSYKIRGAYNKIISLTKKQRDCGIVCASAGNHAQGVAYACSHLKISGTIYMPTTTPKQKISKVKMFGSEWVKVILIGDTFDEASFAAKEDVKKNNTIFIPPFDDKKVIEGQATIALEIISQSKTPIDYIFLPIGGGGLAAGVGTCIKELSPNTKIIGVEPLGAPSMKKSIEAGELITLDSLDNFVDGAAVQRCGELNFEICKNILDDIILVPEGRVCTHILNLYNEDAMVVEPAGTLSVAALDFYKDEIKGKNVVCLISGSNNDIIRMEDIKERSLIYEGLKHYFVIEMPQRSGALKEFLDEVLSPTDDITHFEYHKKTSRDQGPITIAIEVQKPEHLEGLLQRIKGKNLDFEYLNERPVLFEFLA